MNDNSNETLVDPKRNFRSLVRRVALLTAAVAAVLLIAIAGIVAGIYKLGWENAAAQAVANVVPLPAGKAGDTVITVNEYFGRVNLLKGQQPTASPEVIRKDAFNQLADEVFIGQYVRVNKLTADPKSVGQFIKAQNKYGTDDLNPEQVRAQAEGAVLAGQINQDLISGNVGSQVARAYADKEIATLQSKDETEASPNSSQNNTFAVPIEPSQSGGDTALTSLSLLPVEAQTTFLEMRPGQVTEVPIATAQGLLVGKYVKNDEQGNPLIQFVIIQPTLEQWLEYKNISGSRRAYLPQAN